MTVLRRSRRTGWLVFGCLALGSTGCGSPSQPTDPALSAEERGSASLTRELAPVRQATAGFQSFGAAQQAGYTTALTTCLSDPQGGMGFHYGNGNLIDGAVTATQPEVLLYEPQPDRSLRLVGIEYIVPLDAWPGAAPPSLFGHSFHRNDVFGLWTLHVWLWKENPSGLFADWNPTVSCAAAR